MLKAACAAITAAAASMMFITDAGTAQERILPWRDQVRLSGDAAVVTVDLAGGSIVGFHHADNPVNPLTWNYPRNGDTTPMTIAHFVCFDRWGPPSDAEKENGIPNHGEASVTRWDVLEPTQTDANGITSSMQCVLPIGGLRLTRTITLHRDAAIFDVTETIANLNPLGRVYNIVQHPTIAPPFLDRNVRVDTNAWKGLLQSSPMPTPEEPVVYWPCIPCEGSLDDMRRAGHEPFHSVVSFRFRDGAEYGWVTAANPARGLLIGYIWELEEYPWLNLWRDVRNGRPTAYGMEFGTTGLHKPHADILEKARLFGRPIFAYIDAGGETKKRYTAFLARIPADYGGTAAVDYDGATVILTEKRDEHPRTITVGR